MLLLLLLLLLLAAKRPADEDVRQGQAARDATARRRTSVGLSKSAAVTVVQTGSLLVAVCMHDSDTGSSCFRKEVAVVLKLLLFGASRLRAASAGAADPFGSKQDATMA